MDITPFLTLLRNQAYGYFSNVTVSKHRAGRKGKAENQKRKNRKANKLGRANRRLNLRKGN